jgi:hypothetical protein
MKNHYEVLGVSEDASQEEIKNAYNSEIKLNSSDNSAVRERRFTELSEAWFTLSNQRERAKYDFKLTGKVKEETKKPEPKEVKPVKRSGIVGGIYTFLVILGVILLIGIIAPPDFTVYPVQCNDWIMPTYPYTETAPAVQDFSSCHKPEALERQVFKVDVAKSQVIQTSPDGTEVTALQACTVQDKQHWSCGNFTTMPGGILGATQMSRSGDNFTEDGLSAVILVTEDQWNSINGGKDSICGTGWCTNTPTTTTGTTSSTSATQPTTTDASSSSKSTDTSLGMPAEKCVTEHGVKICDLSHSVQNTYGDGTRTVSFQANAIDCVNVATGNQTQNQGNTVQVDGGNTYCASDIGAVYIDPTIQVAKYFGKIMKDSDTSPYYVPATYGTCIWTYADGNGAIPYMEVSNNAGPSSDTAFNVEAFCQNGNNQVDIYSATS